MRYLRFQAATPNARGVHPGIFALANGLARDGRLDEADHAWWVAGNAWYDAAYPAPGVSDATSLDRSWHPVVTCWFVAAPHGV